MSLLPKTLCRRYSDFTETDLIVMTQGKHRVLGAGGYVNYSLWSEDENDLFLDRYWGQMLSLLSQKIPAAKVDRVLIMGLAGGTLAYLVNHYFESTQMVGVEIDPEVISLGYEYFYLGKIPNLKIILDDVVSWVDKQPVEQYDLILMDLFHLAVTPENCDSVDFFRQSIKLLNSGGTLVLNKIFRRSDHKDKIEQYIKERFQDYFETISYERYKCPLNYDNVLIFGQSKR